MVEVVRELEQQLWTSRPVAHPPYDATLPGKLRRVKIDDRRSMPVIIMRSGRMRWTVEDQSLEAEPGDVIITPAGTAHGYEVLGDEPARAVCIDSPKRPKPES